VKSVELHPVDEFVNPNGIPDRLVGEAEARLWLLSQDDRRHGGEVSFDETTERWTVVGAVLQAMKALCVICGKSFNRVRTTAKYCSGACKKRGHRAECPAKKPRPTWNINGPYSVGYTPANTGGPDPLSVTHGSDVYERDHEEEGTSS
jgi:hypothetical protein